MKIRIYIAGEDFLLNDRAGRALICIKMKRLIISGSNDRPCNPSEYKSL